MILVASQVFSLWSCLTTEPVCFVVLLLFPWANAMVLGFLSMGESLEVNFLVEYKRLCSLRDAPGAIKKQKVDAKGLARRMLARQVTL